MFVHHLGEGGTSDHDENFVPVSTSLGWVTARPEQAAGLEIGIWL
jgi:hypothetical protein